MNPLQMIVAAPRRLLLAAALVSSMAGLSPVWASDVVLGTPITGDTRLIQYHYNPDHTYLVLGRPKAVTHLQFAANEVIRTVAAGDTSSWEITPTKDRRNLFVKPKFEGLETTLTVLTDERAYQFVLRSTGEGRKWHQRVTWIYGSDMLLQLPDLDTSSGPTTAGSPSAASVSGGRQQPVAAAPVAQPAEPSIVAGIRPEKLRFTYEVAGDAAFKPVIVFDDGRFTYLKLPPAVQELPALFAVSESGEYSLVNFEVQGEYMVAQRLLNQAVLKLGRSEVKVTMQAPTKPRPFFGVRNGE